MALVRAAVADGRTMQRVHVVREPLTDYTCFEVAWSYAYSVAAGEDVRIVPLAEGEAWPSGIPRPGGDFWLFDDTGLFQMHYDADGTWLDLRRKRLANALRSLREAALPSGSELARRAGWVQPKVSRLETGAQLPTEGDIRTWAKHTGASDVETEALLDMLSAAHVDYIPTVDY